MNARLALAILLLWAAPCSALGLALALPAWLAGGSVRRRGRVLEVAACRGAGDAGSPLARLPFVAITFGHVVLGASEDVLERWREHERVHVAQYERLGPLFLVAYPLASLGAWAAGRDAYRDNRFEAEAYAAQAGIRPGPPAGTAGGC